MTAHVLAMALSGLAVSAVVPGIILATRGSALWPPLTPPPAVAFPFFLVLHAVVVLGPVTLRLGTPARVLLEAALLVGSVVFWLPVVGPARRLSEPGRCLYLYLAMPSLDLPAVWLVALGHQWGALAMILGMLPMGGAAMAVTWRWVTAEERAEAQAEEAGRPRTEPLRPSGTPG